MDRLSTQVSEYLLNLSSGADVDGMSVAVSYARMTKDTKTMEHLLPLDHIADAWIVVRTSDTVRLAPATIHVITQSEACELNDTKFDGVSGICNTVVLHGDEKLDTSTPLSMVLARGFVYGMDDVCLYLVSNEKAVRDGEGLWHLPIVHALCPSLEAEADVGGALMSDVMVLVSLLSMLRGCCSVALEAGSLHQSIHKRIVVIYELLRRWRSSMMALDKTSKKLLLRLEAALPTPNRPGEGYASIADKLVAPSSHLITRYLKEYSNVEPTVLRLVPGFFIGDGKFEAVCHVDKCSICRSSSDAVLGGLVFDMVKTAAKKKRKKQRKRRQKTQEPAKIGERKPDDAAAIELATKLAESYVTMRTLCAELSEQDTRLAHLKETARDRVTESKKHATTISEGGKRERSLVAQLDTTRLKSSELCSQLLAYKEMLAAEKQTRARNRNEKQWLDRYMAQIDRQLIDPESALRDANECIKLGAECVNLDANIHRNVEESIRLTQALENKIRQADIELSRSRVPIF